MTMQPSKDDLEAARKITGKHPHWLGVHDLCSRQTCLMAGAIDDPLYSTLRTWDVPSSTDPGKSYHVDERVDTKYGGTYLFCSCPSWPTKKGQGKNCKHVERIQAMLLDAVLIGAPR